MQLLLLVTLFAVSDSAGVDLPACPKGIFHGFCHPWELRDGGVACVRDVSPAAKIMKSSDVQCVPKKNGGSRYRCPSWVPQMCQPVYDGKNIVQLAESVPELSTLVAAVVAGDLADTLSSTGPFTVFAPTNKAFSALPAGTLGKLMKPENKKELVDILTYHVLPEAVFSTDLKASQAVKTVEGKTLEVTKSGSLVRVGPSSKDLKNVIKADNLASNGVVHIIDGVLLPPSSTKNIVQLAESVSELSTLVAAVVAGDLADTLSSPGPFTVFAPTNKAFAALPAGTLEKLMKPESKKELIDILTYHVLPEAVFSTDLKASQAVKTVEGKTLDVTKSGGLVRVGPSSQDLKNVIKADNLASNGVVHIIDGVLLPPTPTAIIV